MFKDLLYSSRRLLCSGAACAALGAVALSAPAEAKASSSCGSSAATVAADVWQQFGNEAVAIGCAVGTVVAGMDFSACYASATKYASLLETMVSWWNKMADNSWLTIGPRQIVVGDEPLSGTLTLGGTRIFCTPAPVAESKVKIRITKDGGKAKTSVDICKMKKDGSSSTEWDYTWASGNDNIGKTEARTVDGAKDKVLCVKLNNKSALKKFSYKISAVKG